MNTYLIAIAVFLVAFATFVITIEVLSPENTALNGNRRKPTLEVVAVTVRTLFLSDGSDVSPKMTALLLPLAWVSLAAIVGSLLTCIHINLEFRSGRR